MSLFKKLFGKENQEEKVQVDNSDFKTHQKSDGQSFEELFEQNAGLSFEKQMILGDVIGSNSWQFDMGSGTISFGDALRFPVQVIGSLSFNDSSWMWGWANAKSGIPENLLVQSNELKKLGEQKQIPELTDGHFSVEEGFEHKMGMAACGLFKSKAYYCANYGQGTLVVTIDSKEIPDIDKNRYEKMLTSFPQLISNIDVNHKAAFINYLIDREFQLKEENDKIEGSKDGKTITGEFDDMGRLKNLGGKI
ncbi:hypothetical protein LVD17_00520 [Fulvivirga ulvae]|uniref:DUF6882 domain-containing protein n=1 Tax=Fulvivirga ulvae TaxID=2904245 RepID=UPI001F2E32E7|nr:DUF6882 domain-containing protein [Fulvivirga ulvae]UII32321.1 hypothetical protein LVD17_00520 [Fulvivirga ulvae]